MASNGESGWHCRGERKLRVCLDRPYPGAAPLPQFEVAALCTTRRETAKAAARQLRGAARLLRP